MTEIDETPDPKAVETKKPRRPKPPRKKPDNDESEGVGLPVVLVCSAVATVLGITGGAWLGSTLLEPQAVTQSEISKAELDSVKSTLEALKNRTAKIEKKQSEIMQGKAIVSGASLEGVEDVQPLFNEIEARLKMLEHKLESSTKLVEAPADKSIIEEIEAKTENGEKPAIEPSETEKIGESSKTDIASTSELTETETSEIQDTKLQDELNTLAENLSSLEKQLETQSKSFVSLSDLNGLKRRVKTLETEFEKPPVLIPPFPRESVMDALTGKSEKSGSWMSGLLGDEVRVVDAEIVSRLDRIEKFVEAGDITAIDKEVTYLPTEAKPVIDSWLAQFKQSK